MDTTTCPVLLLASWIAWCLPAEAQPLFVPAPGSPIAVAGGPQNIVSGDLDGDGKHDLITADQGGSVTIFLGDGRGGFHPAPSSRIGLPISPGEMALGDVDGDGKLDLALTEHDSYGVTILLGDGRGGFAPAPGSPFASKDGRHPHTHGLALGDVNADGKADLVTANNADGDVAVLLGDGRGHFRGAPGSPFPVGPSPYPIAIGDLDGDGMPDIAAPNSSPGHRTVTVLLGDGRGGFRPASKSPFSTAGQAYYVALADVNGDRKVDLVATHNEDGHATVLLGNGRGEFEPSPASPVDLGHRAWGVVVRDVDRDGRVDLVTAAGDSVRVMLGDGRGSFAPAPGSPFAVGKGAWRLAVDDFNKDGKPDVATSDFESKSVTVLLGN